MLCFVVTKTKKIGRHKLLNPDLFLFFMSVNGGSLHPVTFYGSKRLPPSPAENFPSSTHGNPITWKIPPRGNYGFQNLKIFFESCYFLV